MTPTPHRRSVTVAIPVFNEGAHIDGCLASIERQTYADIVEILVVDGGSADDTTSRAAAHPRVRVLDNPRRMQAAALNVALAEAKGEVFVRVDGHCELDERYVEACVDALDASGAALVGGAMTPHADEWFGRGVAEAMTSRVGAGPARFHVGGGADWVDTVYLGAGPTEVLRRLGGYAEDVGVNEDTEMAYRAHAEGGVWFDPAIRSRYTPRGSLRAVARQFFRYGLSRAATTRKHPRSLKPRQLFAPALVVALVLFPRRRLVVLAYGLVVTAETARVAGRDPGAAAAVPAVLPAMHLSWGVGFLAGLCGWSPPRPPS